MPRLFVNSTAQKVIKQYKYINDLTIPQFLEGFTHMIKREPDYRVKEQMLDHLTDIAITMQDFAWQTTREWSNSVMISIGQGSFNWGNAQSIEKEKLVKLMGASALKSSTSTTGKNACLAFNSTKCQENDSHGPEHLHVCSFCLAAFAAEHDHPVMACHKRLNYRRGRESSDRYEHNQQYKNTDW